MAAREWSVKRDQPERGAEMYAKCYQKASLSRPGTVNRFKKAYL